MPQRQEEGIAKDQRDGKYKGRKPTARNQAAKVIEMVQAGTKTAEIAKQLGMSVFSAS